MIRNLLIFIIMLQMCYFGCGQDASTRRESQKTAGKVTVEPVTFAVFGNSGLATDNGEAFSSLAAAIDTCDIDFVVNIGNSLPEGVPPSGTQPLWEEVDKSRELFKVPVYPVAGKTDIFDYKSDVEYSERYGPLWYSFERNGVLFIVMTGEDESYKVGFGVQPRLSDDQCHWLKNCLRDSADNVFKVLFIDRPLWQDSPALWKNTLLPIIGNGTVDLIITLYDYGLFDWGTIDGIHAVSTGCTGTISAHSAGLFPHFLVATISGKTPSFRILNQDGTMRDGISINTIFNEKLSGMTAPLKLSPMTCTTSWNINETIEMPLKNTMDGVVSCRLAFLNHTGAAWHISPEIQEVNLEPGMTKTLHIGIKGNAPDLGPLPSYSYEVISDGKLLADRDTPVTLKIPQPRTGEVIAVSAKVADMIPYNFDGSTLKIPIDVESIDTCGRLIICRQEEDGTQVCVFTSNLKDFNPGINDFLWNGHDMNGNIVAPGGLKYFIALYNKKAPVTWVANAHPSPGGTFTVQATLQGLNVETHTESSLVTYPITGDINQPEPNESMDVSAFLDGLPLTGYARGDKGILYLGTSAGIVSVSASQGKLRLNPSFGEGGYVRLLSYRSRSFGGPRYHNGLIYMGIGGNEVNAPAILVMDSETGEQKQLIDLSDFIPPFKEPPSIAVNDKGILIAHPENDIVLMMTHYGDVLWVNEAGDLIGDCDSDGHSFTYGPAMDDFGFSYVNSPGSSARCGVIGPDGTGLFRVILVQMPGLRVSSVFPMIEGKKTDGLYFVTRGGDRPYVFHIPYTIRNGMIVDKDELVSMERNSR